MESLDWRTPETGTETQAILVPSQALDDRHEPGEQPSNDPSDDVTDLLRLWREGDAEAFGRLLPGVYQELHRLACGAMRGERRDHTLQATALVHETYLRLSRGEAPAWRNRGHFFAVVARTMRHILVDHARAAAAARRGGGASVVRFGALVDDGEGVAGEGGDPLDVLMFDEALSELAAVRPRQAKVIELRSFSGLSVVEVAKALGVSRQTVVLDTRLGRAWLVARLWRGHG